MAWLAVAQARGQGVNFLLSILALVWWWLISGLTLQAALWACVSHAASLRPPISPGKSWEGVWGGMLATVVKAIV